MVRDTDMRTGTHMHMGEAVWDGLNTYSQPVRVREVYTNTVDCACV